MLTVLDTGAPEPHLLLEVTENVPVTMSPAWSLVNL
jgi:hypothetical protein